MSEYRLEGPKPARMYEVILPKKLGKDAWVAGADRREAPGPNPVRLGRRLRLRRQPPGSWQIWNGGDQGGVSKFVVSQQVAARIPRVDDEGVIAHALRDGQCRPHPGQAGIVESFLDQGCIHLATTIP